MARKIVKSRKISKSSNDKANEENQTPSKSQIKANENASSSAQNKRSLSRKEKLEAVRKANQALLKTLKLMSQRDGSGTNAQSDV